MKLGERLRLADDPVIREAFERLVDRNTYVVRRATGPPPRRIFRRIRMRSKRASKNVSMSGF